MLDEEDIIELLFCCRGRLSYVSTVFSKETKENLKYPSLTHGMADKVSGRIKEPDDFSFEFPSGIPFQYPYP